MFLPALLERHENYTYIVSFSPLKIEQYVNDVLTQVVNPTASLYVESSTQAKRNDQSDQLGCFTGLRKRTDERTGEDIFAPGN